MARVFITGSSDGLGLLAAKELVAQGHQVVLHARNETRARETFKKLPAAENVVTADLSNITDTKLLASKVNDLGKFDAVIHNAGVYSASGKEIFAVNTLAPYILTCLIHKPKRLIYLSSGMHLHGSPKLESFKTNITSITYSDSKLHVILLCMAVARRWPDVFANSVNPGWVPTKMGGKSAPDNLERGFETQVWLSVSDDEQVKVSGRYFFHQKERRFNHEAENVRVQEMFLSLCEEITSVSFP